jgi:hypothetical protein
MRMDLLISRNTPLLQQAAQTCRRTEMLCSRHTDRWFTAQLRAAAALEAPRCGGTGLLAAGDHSERQLHAIQSIASSSTFRRSRRGIKKSGRASAPPAATSKRLLRPIGQKQEAQT